jgi:hypothetical protein
LSLVEQPAGFCFDLGWQPPLQALQRCQGGLGIGAQGISLHDTHIPLAGAVRKRDPPEGHGQKLKRQGAGNHQLPLRFEVVQSAQNRC